METFSALLALCAGNSQVTGEFRSHRPATRSFNVFFDLRLSKRLSKQSSRRWFETPPRSLWRHRNESPEGNFTRVTPPSITKLSLKMICLKLHSNFPGINGLTIFVSWTVMIFTTPYLSYSYPQGLDNRVFHHLHSFINANIICQHNFLLLKYGYKRYICLISTGVYKRRRKGRKYWNDSDFYNRK